MEKKTNKAKLKNFQIFDKIGGILIKLGEIVPSMESQ